MPKDPSRTEKPTGRRIRKAREKGDVLVSQEITSLSVVICGGVAILMSAGAIADGFGGVLQHALTGVNFQQPWTLREVHNGTLTGLLLLTRLLAPALTAITLAALLSTRFQVGHYFQLSALEWKPDQLNPITGFNRIMPNKDNIVKMLLVMAKVSVIAIIVWTLIRRHLPAIIGLGLHDYREALSWLRDRAVSLVAIILGFFVAVAVADYLWKRHQYMDKLMMTKQEVKDEHKEMEGDPRVKGRLRSKMREMTMMRLMAEVPQADVVLTNPTHVAVALRYRPGSFAPQVVAKGLRKRALHIRDIATRYGVPIIEAPPLARALYRGTRVGGFIPAELYGAVAAILARLHRQGRRDFSAHARAARETMTNA